MQQASTSSSTGNEQSRQPRLVGIDRLLSRLSTLRERIARRAFEIFKGRGGTNGSDLDDWFQAEAELCRGVRLEVTELDDALTVHTAVPGFSADQLEVCVEPYRVTIVGERNTVDQLPTSDQLLVVFTLPAAVDPSNVTAALQNGVLELAMLKAPRFFDLLFESKQDSIVRAEDSRAWVQSFVQRMPIH